MDYVPKTDCFGYKLGKCTILTDLFCSYEECSFYKTTEQYNSDRIKYEEIQKSRGDAT